MAHQKKTSHDCTPMQERFVQLVAANRQLHKTEQVAEAKLYTQAGSASKSPHAGAAQDLRKPHVKARLIEVLKDKYGVVLADSGVKTEQEEAEENLKKWSTQSSQGANNYALYLLKKKEAGIIEKTVRKVLLSSFLPEDELDLMAADMPDDVVIAGKKMANKA